MLDLPIVAAFRPAPAVTLGHGHRAVQAPARGCRAGRAAQRHRAFALLLLARGGLIRNIHPCFSLLLSGAGLDARILVQRLAGQHLQGPGALCAHAHHPGAGLHYRQAQRREQPIDLAQAHPRSPALMRDTWLASQPMASPTTSFLTAARRRRIRSRTGSAMRVIPYASRRILRHAKMLAPPMTAA